MRVSTHRIGGSEEESIIKQDGKWPQQTFEQAAADAVTSEAAVTVQVVPPTPEPPAREVNAVPPTPASAPEEAAL